ncbi:hypothetical protein [Tanticharoenia sakaeratensis]|uniref:Uncharacterized protein n=1 Tax=Tanticharoenia sakaeratensis NBRC 103193 TaxID=1231623 RepID=A0A0D6MQ76_9PROT|nr:hypothetical protein [Tanticharoenia sakaeratensis]GAN55550.1 hypothetical protein Tasa_048_175 [Tanticharoenia sakaeratensis NBRC 103193]GBQ21762.1 hypothetical protein AA103193_1838 [Tanticharoenia sakaeratensis NBRC 103193]
MTRDLRISQAAETPEAWLDLRQMLWPEADDHQAAIVFMKADTAAWLAWIDGTACGLCEAALRRDYVNGCSTTPAAFLEGYLRHA